MILHYCFISTSLNRNSFVIEKGIWMIGAMHMSLCAQMHKKPTALPHSLYDCTAWLHAPRTYLVMTAHDQWRWLGLASGRGHCPLPTPENFPIFWMKMAYSDSLWNTVLKLICLQQKPLKPIFAFTRTSCWHILTSARNKTQQLQEIAFLP